MNGEVNDFAVLEQEREHLHNLTVQRKGKPLSSDDLVEQSRKVDNIITPIQKNCRQQP